MTDTVRNTDIPLINELQSLYESARSKRQEYSDNWARNFRLVHNRHNAGSPTGDWRPSPKDSEIYPILAAQVGWLTDQENRTEYAPVMEPNSVLYADLGQRCSDLEAIMYSNSVTESYAVHYKLAIWDALMYGLGVLKAVWDGSRGGGYGNAVPKRIDPWCFLPSPDATSLEDMDYCIEVHKLSLEEVCRRWPRKAASLTASMVTADDGKPDLGPSSGMKTVHNLGALAPATSTRWSNPTRNGPGFDLTKTVVVKEFWIKENQPVTSDDEDDGVEMVANWRVVVLCQNQILMDELAEDVFPFNNHPYERYVFDDTGEFIGISLVDHLANPQIYINRLLTAYQHNTELTGNPVLVESTQSGTIRQSITNRPGQRIRVQGPAGMANKPEWMVPPAMSTDVLNLIQFWIARMENISGLSGVVKGATPAQRNPEGVISTIQEAAFVRVRAAMRNWEDTLYRLHLKLTDLVIENYTEPRYVGILGPDGSKTAKMLASNYFTQPGQNGLAPLQYIMSMKGGSTFPTSRQARIAEAIQLYTLGAVDDQYLLEVCQITNIPVILGRKAEKEAMGMIPPGARQRSKRSQ